jgi:cytosine/adenosine deaminase-related metal-dependent hydrolase
LKILKANFVLICDDEFKVIENGAVVFDQKIIDVDTADNLISKYPDIECEDCGENSVLMSGLINSHVHLEFSANKTTLQYGNFMQWLYSVIANREELIEKADEKLISNELKQMLKSGTTTIGAISSYGFDMQSCATSDINVVYFTEVIGSKMEMIDTLFADFKARLSSAKSLQNDSFVPAVAIHSPYSVHPFLVREVLKIAKEDDMSVSAHFMESRGENDWLNYSKGEFTQFFNNFLQQSISTGKPFEFLNLFKGIKDLSLTHCVEANERELDQIKQLDATIIHCPNSNRLLNNKALNLEHTKGINIALGTDGLSSNNSLNLFDEIQNALFIHTNNNIEDLAKLLLIASTKGGAKALGLNKGSLESSKDADIISFRLPDSCSVDNIASSIALHIKGADKVYIKGNQIELS